jgi:hypothetical protein
MTTALKCSSCGDNISFQNGVAVCPSCGTTHLTDNKSPVQGGIVTITIPLNIAVGQTLRKLGELVGQGFPGDNPYVNLVYNDGLNLKILEMEPYRETKTNFGLFWNKNEIIELIRYKEICRVVFDDDDDVTFEVKGQKYMPKMTEIAKKVAKALNCSCNIFLDHE